VDFIIEFEALAIKMDTDELHTIVLLKKNIRSDIIKMILGYPPIAAPETLKEWKMAITSVEQGYESTEGRNNYKTGTEMTYGGQEQPMDIGKSNDNFKDGKPKYFNCNKYDHMAKECWRKKEKKTLKCFKKNWMTKRTKRMIRSRVLEKISSRHSTRDHPCKVL